MVTRITAVRRIVTAAFRPLRGRDLALHAAAVTFYGGIAVVPVALLAIWLTGLVVGADGVRDLTGYTVQALPDAIGANRALAALIEAGLHLSPLFALASLLPATLYGEGLRRAFVSLRDPGEALVGWRGRLLVLPLFAAAPALLLSLLMALPLASRLWLRGGWASVAGVVLSFLAAWLVLTPVVIWLYRAVAPGTPQWLASVSVGSFTAANLSGCLFCSFPLDLGVPFGGFTEIGAAVAVGLWLYLFHVIVLAGYAATWQLSHWLDGREGGPRPPIGQLWRRAGRAPRCDSPTTGEISTGLPHGNAST
jgi:membrane protein